MLNSNHEVILITWGWWRTWGENLTLGDVEQQAWGELAIDEDGEEEPWGENITLGDAKQQPWGELDYTLTLLVGLQIVVHWGEVDTEQKHTFALKKVDKSIHFKAGDYKRQNGEDMKIHPVRKSLLSSHKERWPTRKSHPNFLHCNHQNIETPNRSQNLFSLRRTSEETLTWMVHTGGTTQVKRT